MQELNYNYNLQLVKSSKVSFIDFLLNSYKFFQIELLNYETHKKKIYEFFDSDSLLTYLKIHSINIPEQSLSLICSQIIIGEDPAEVCENFEIYPIELIQLSQIKPKPRPQLKKKSTSKYIT